MTPIHWECFQRKACVCKGKLTSEYMFLHLKLHLLTCQVLTSGTFDGAFLLFQTLKLCVCLIGLLTVGLFTCQAFDCILIILFTTIYDIGYLKE